MTTETTRERTAENVRQFSIFTANRMGRLYDVFSSLERQKVHVLGFTVLDTTDSAIIRLVVDDPEQARGLLLQHGFPFTESELVVVEFDYTTDVSRMMAAFLEAELNINYLYSFIPHPRGKSLLALSLEDNEIAEQILKRHQFRVLKQADLSR
ncbi:MAG: acetolactate synthase [Verrucomicrobia bacterium]|nr:acetolactate synthase [Verrucomicrobiota bacterium]